MLAGEEFDDALMSWHVLDGVLYLLPDVDDVLLPVLVHVPPADEPFEEFVCVYIDWNIEFVSSDFIK